MTGEPDDENARARAARAGSPYLTSKQAAHHLGISHRTLVRLRSGGKGPEGRQHGGAWRYHVDDLDRWSRQSKDHP